MKNIIILLFLLLALAAFGQMKPNLYDTNSTATVDAHVISLVGTNALPVSVVWASKAGVPLDGNLTNQTGTSATAAIQAILDTATNGIYLEYHHDGVSLLNNSNSIVIHSHTHFIVEPGGGFYLGTSNNCAMMRGVMPTNFVTFTNNDIFVEGGTWYGNIANQALCLSGFNTQGSEASVFTNGNFFVCGMWFASCNHLRIKNVTMINAGIYHMMISDSDNVTLDQVTTSIQDPFRAYGTDPFHFIGNMSNLKMLNCSTYNVLDDVLAFNTTEASGWPLQTNFNRPLVFGITNIVVDGLTATTTNRNSGFWPNVWRFQGFDATAKTNVAVRISNSYFTGFKNFQSGNPNGNILVNNCVFDSANISGEPVIAPAGSSFVFTGCKFANMPINFISTGIIGLVGCTITNCSAVTPAYGNAYVNGKFTAWGGIDASNLTGTIVLNTTGVVPGTYTNPLVTIQSDGRITSASSSSSTSTLTNGLMGYWSFQTTNPVPDLSGNNYNLASSGPVNQTNGIIGLAGNFTNAYLVTSNLNFPMGTTSGGFSASFWISGLTGGIYVEIVDIPITKGLFSLSDTHVGLNNASLGTTTFTMRTNYQHVVFTVDGSGNWKFYTNGVIQSTGTVTAFTANAGMVTVGAEFDGALKSRCNVDELGFWTRPLSTNEIAALYNAGVGLSPYLPAFPSSMVVGASPFNFTNTLSSTLHCWLSDSTAITTSVGINGVTVLASTTDLNSYFPLRQNEYVTLTYSGGTPTLFTNR